MHARYSTEPALFVVNYSNRVVVCIDENSFVFSSLSLSLLSYALNPPWKRFRSIVLYTFAGGQNSSNIQPLNCVLGKI